MDLSWLVGPLLALASVWALLVALVWFLRPRDVALPEVLRVIPDVVRLVRRLIGDRSVPLGARAALTGLLVWLLSPIDLVPEFIPILGPLDDVVVAIIVLRYVRRRIGEDGLRVRWQGTPAGYQLLQNALSPSRRTH